MKYALAALLTAIVLTLAGAASVASAQTYAPYGMYYPTYQQPSYGACIVLTRDLAYGMRGSDVSSLQRFLVSQNYPGGGSWMITGFYGRATEAAVRIFQGANAIYPTGIVDASTRGALTRGCSYPTYPPYPTYPTYPSNVTLTYVNPNAVAAGSNVTLTGYGFDAYNNTVYIGGNSVGSYPSYNGTTITVTVPSYLSGMTTVYVRNSRGTSNTLSLTVLPNQSCGYPYYSSGCCQGSWSGGYCNPGNVSISYLSPSSGQTGTQVTVTGTGFSYSGNTVRFGNSSIQNVQSFNGTSLTFTVPSYDAVYGYQTITPGIYNVSVVNASGFTSNTLPFTVTSYGSGGPSITSVNGPTSLPVNAQGTWTVTVFNPSSSYITTSVNWGDSSYGSGTAPQTTYAQNSSTLTFTHAYPYAGTYTVTFTVINSSGQQNTSTMTVTVGGTTGSAYLSASPTYGVAPLSVTFTAQPNAGCSGGAFYIFYGDGANELLQTSSGTCNPTLTRTHVYSGTGTFAATLRSYDQSTVLATAQVTVSSQSGGGSLFANPSTGTKPLSVSFTGSANGQSYANGVVISFGDGTAASFCAPGEACTQRTVTHVYNGAGTYNVLLLGTSGGTTTTLGSTSVIVNN